ncbi:MAG: polyprenyl synthetase family protein, partial [Bacteroidales bacterium]|nr:polyprenyl synthetase family protein [Bacteroidales bacterium]
KVSDFGRNLGIAFQIQDDLLDTFGDPEVFGKNIGNDIVANKKTILLIKALELASGDQLKSLNGYLTMKDFDPGEKISAVKKIYEELKVRSAVEDLAWEYTKLAYTSLEDVELDNGRKEELMNLAAKLLNRKY